MKKQSIVEILKKKSQLQSYGLMALALIYLFFVIVPTAKGLLVKLLEVGQLKAMTLKTTEDWRNIEALKKRVAELNQKIDSYEKKLPGEKEIPAILEYLSAAAKELDLKLTEIKPVEQTKEQDQVGAFYYKAPILLSAESPYHNLGRFINKLENADRFMKISNIKILANPNSPGIHYVQLTVVTYVMK
ncbi:MAG: type 4a pilus biogenesis protein PilO [Candidatus Omnitrophica bacterium]|nr:type 4a pilus biogenesis protein PilO [Candidatus Omnitrophota bacterium]